MTRAALIFGGISTEHDISCKSADNVISVLGDRLELVLVGITKDGAWHLVPPGTSPLAAWEDDASLPGVALVPGAGLVELPAGGEARPLAVDVALPILHGQGGEDGTIQGALDVAGVPYVGCGVMASSICVDKDSAHRLAAAAGVRSPRCEVLWRGASPEDRAAAVASCGGFPVFVKPARGGSSIGVSRAADEAAYERALEAAFALDEKVAVEEAITGIEVGCAVVGDAAHGIWMGEPDEIVVPEDGFFAIHLEKDPSANTELRCPSELPADVLARVREAGARVYEALGCEGLARVDLFVTPEGEVVFNEVNTMPGLTTYSRFPQMMRVAGHELGDVLMGIVKDRLARA
ncbi:D-alanine--D-alanine ligase family protein [Olsenella profusa]|uniref:D-alanine--D-alanine ligase n=1 Tax=Olsenella profusa TaxID=138595 RepID=A0ABS2F1H6_9ACTN|nr:D-alanine--D-alanine ligase family protein [Olsenella profusa]MBM6774831.1 D-alanine--D-alanine ligase [Olsenella profusa]